MLTLLAYLAAIGAGCAALGVAICMASATLTHKQERKE